MDRTSWLIIAMALAIVLMLAFSGGVSGPLPFAGED